MTLRMTDSPNVYRWAEKHRAREKAKAAEAEEELGYVLPGEKKPHERKDDE